eukprot:Pgem_evm1s11461
MVRKIFESSKQYNLSTPNDMICQNNIEKQRCLAMLQNGRQCSMYTYFGPFCSRHIKLTRLKFRGGRGDNRYDIVADKTFREDDILLSNDIVNKYTVKNFNLFGSSKLNVTGRNINRLINNPYVVCMSGNNNNYCYSTDCKPSILSVIEKVGSKTYKKIGLFHDDGQTQTNIL